MVTMVSRALKDMAPRLDEHASFLGWCPEIYCREVYADGGVGFAKLFIYLGPRRVPPKALSSPKQSIPKLQPKQVKTMSDFLR